MDPAVMMVLLTAFGCVTGVTLRGMSLWSDARRKALEEQLRLLRLQLDASDMRMSDIERVNHHLEQQVEWQTKLLGAGQPAPRQLDRS